MRGGEVISFFIDRRDLATVEKKLKELPLKTQRKFVRTATRNAAKKHLLPAARNAVPKRTGLYRKSMKIRSVKRSRVTSGVRLASFFTDKQTGKSKKVFYGSFLEYGWKPNTGKEPILGQSGKRVRGRKYLTKMAKRQGPRAIKDAIKSIAAMMREEWRK